MGKEERDEQTIQNDKASDYFKPEDHALASEAGVESLHDDTHAHVDHSNDDRGSHLDAVDEGQVLG